SVKQSIRETASETIRTTAAKMTYADLQKIMLSGELEDSISKVVKVIYPTKTCVIRKSQLLQEGVENNAGPTLDEIHAQEARLEAEMKAKKAALLAAAAEEDAPVQDADDEGEEDSADEQEAVAEETVEEVVEEEPTEESVEEAEEEAPAESSDDDLSTIPGVGPATVTKLQDAGFTSFASLLNAGVEGISEVKGVSAALAEKIIAHLS
ncbi:MAG: helix-hairpin-helix domain-containing protein, partial [Candidatus Thermoplasmatota archaeon]|nr:helix-hairpin-helix domain-containing protein [Candidatus Thermoplasmatota archaeon]